VAAQGSDQQDEAECSDPHLSSADQPRGSSSMRLRRHGLAQNLEHAWVGRLCCAESYVAAPRWAAVLRAIGSLYAT
jgi:hypothetical protein